MSGGTPVSSLGTVDYVVFAFVLAISMGIGLFFAFRGNRSLEDFLLGGRKMSVIPVSLSLLSSFVTPITLLSYSGEVYAHGMQLSMMICGAFLSIYAAANITLPVFYPLKLTSINEYLELRYNSKGLRFTIMMIGTLADMFFLGIWLYAPALALSSVTPISIHTYIILLGIVCTFYSALGGLKAVVWTDAFQMIVILMGVGAVIIVASLDVGGIKNVWRIANEHGRIQFFDLSVNIYERHNLLNVLVLGSAFYFFIYGVNQTTLQRAYSVSTMEKAKSVYFLNLIGMVLCVITVFFSGLCIFASYAGCDPLTQGRIVSKDQILPYFVMDKMSFLSGLPGLLIACIVSGASSSMSSVINAQVAIIWTDLLLKFSFFQKLSKSGATFANKILSFLIGGVMISIALFAQNFRGLFQIAMTFMGSTGGPLLGVYVSGLLIPHVGKKGASAGLVLSSVVMIWLSTGAYFYQTNPTMLHLSTENCTTSINSTPIALGLRRDFDFTNTTAISLNTDEGIVTDSSPQNTETITERIFCQTTEEPEIGFTEEDSANDHQGNMLYFYGISYTLFTALGSLLSVITAVIVTFITGAEDLTELRPDLIAPISRRFLKKKTSSLLSDHKLSCISMNKV